MVRNCKKVFVAVSGGVDSSVAAALLRESGHDVTGVFIEVWQPSFFSCSWREDRIDAMRICAELSIPFRSLNLGKEYKKGVVDYMVGEYERGLTPNPDVMCNNQIKFGAFLRYASDEGADCIATGHYACVERGCLRGQEDYSLRRGQDKNKDQSYFLWRLGQEQLKRTMFPVGKYTKDKVRQMAKKFHLSTALKKDSQGLCFLGKLDMKDFLKHYTNTQRGSVLDRTGNVIGTHDGSALYTLGERHGFSVSATNSRSHPLYIIAKDVSANTITVADERARETMSPVIEIVDVNWIGESVKVGAKLIAQTRYRGSRTSCKVKDIWRNRASIALIGRVERVASGQSVVLYDDELCAGGGIVV